MKDNGLQSIAVEARNRKSGPGILQIIGMIIFIAPIIIHSFKWGWIYPLVSLFSLGFLLEILGVFGVILWILLFGGSIYLFRRRFRKMKEKRKLANMPQLYSPSSMRDHD